MGLISDWRQRRTDKAAAARAEALYHEGIRLVAAKDCTRAEPALREATQIHTEMLGPHAVTTLHTRLGYAQALCRLQRYEDAKAEARAVIESGSPRPGLTELVCAARLTLARALKDSGRASEAAAEASAILAVSPGQVRQSIRMAATSLRAGALVTLGRHTDADHTLEAFLSEHADEPIWGVKARSDRAQNLVYLGRYAETEAECRALISLVSQAPGRVDRLVDRASRNALVLALAGLGRATEAESEARAAIDRARRAGVEPRSLLTLRLGLARSLNIQQRHEEALQVLLPAQEEFLGAPTTTNEQLATALHLAIGTARLGLGEHREAEDSVRRALVGCRETLGPFHHRALVADTLHGRVLAAQGRQTEARERLTAASAAWREHFGADHPETRAAEQALAELSGRTGG